MLSPELVRSALESAPDAIVIVDEAGVIVFTNHQVKALFGHAPEDLAGQHVECLLPERFRAGHVGHHERFVIDGRVRPMGAGLELFAQRHDGTEFPVEISLSPIRDGDRTLVAAAVRDVTDRKRIEVELVAARETADRANQGKSRFLAMASHDLRQPLQALALLNGTLRRTVSDPVSAEALAQQGQAIGGMSRLLNALLDISKLESGAIRPDPTDFTVAALFEELRAEFAGLAANKGLEFQVEPCRDCVHSDPSLVEQILRNLLANAIKYTREGCVRLRCLHEEETVVRIQVLDTGIGIPPAHLPYIYDEFYQVGVPTNTVSEGYGLGLSIVQRLVKLLNLGLQVESEVGRGSVFSLVLPASAARTADGEANVTAQSDSSRSPGTLPHVLVVEDDPAVLSATSMLLKVEGYRVTTAASLSEALQKVRDADVDLLITDYHLGGGQTGTEVISSVRAILDADLRAVLVTGDTSTAVKELRHDERVRMASKPINADELLSLLRELLAV
jgi:PAS domain S-box-containing protein